MASVAVLCPRCGRLWEVPVREDGTTPKTARCAITRGGCGNVAKVPARRPAEVPARATGAAVWDPPSEPRQPRPAGEPCPHCGGTAVYAEPRGTIRVCLGGPFGGCGRRVTPPGVLAPYERGAGVTRAAKSQRERDLEALDLAGRKGIMLGQLRGLADGDRLDSASLLKVEWFAEQVKAAASGARLGELAALFAEAGIRPRRFWQARPAALTAGYDDEDTEDGYAEYADDEDQDDEPPAARPALRAIGAAPEMTPDTALGHLGWRLAAPSGGCQVIEHGAVCGAEPRFSFHTAGGVLAWICAVHNNQLTGLISRCNRRMTWAGAIAAAGWRLGAAMGGCCVTGDRTRRRCTGDADRHIDGGWVCGMHYAALSRLITDHNRRIA